MVLITRTAPSPQFIEYVNRLFGQPSYINGSLNDDFDIVRDITAEDLLNLPQILQDNPGKDISVRWEYKRDDATHIEMMYGSLSSVIRPHVLMQVASYGHSEDLLSDLNKIAKKADVEGIDLQLEYTQRAKDKN